MLGVLDEQTLDVVKKSGSTLLVRVLSVVLSFMVSVVLGRFLGAEGLGIINLTERITSILLILSAFGLTQVVLKRIAIAQVDSNWEHINNIVFSALFYTVISTVLLTALLSLFSASIANGIFKESQLKVPLIIAGVAMTFQVMSRIYANALFGIQKVWQGTFLNEVLSIILVAGYLVFLNLSNSVITVLNVVIAYAVSRVICVVALRAFWGSKRKLIKKPKRLSIDFFKEGFPFLLVSATGFLAISLDGIMVGWLSTTKEVGLYAVAAKIALATSFFLQVTNSVLAPKLAALFSQNKITEMNHLVQRITFGLLLLSVIPLLLFVVFGKTFLSVWGVEFREAYFILIALSVGQLFNIGTGASGMVLVMCGYERVQAAIAGFAILVNVCLNYILILEYGALGAALGTAFTITLENILKVIFAKRLTGVLTVPFIKLNSHSSEG